MILNLIFWKTGICLRDNNAVYELHADTLNKEAETYKASWKQNEEKLVQTSLLIKEKELAKLKSYTHHIQDKYAF